MSELKAVHAFDVYEAYTKTGNDDAAQVYPKSEADKAIAELEAMNQDLCERVTENDEIRLHWEEIEQTRAENERMKSRIAELEEERRWRKCSEELPEDGDEVLATDGEEIWLCHKDTLCDGSPWFQPDGLPQITGITHWQPLPSAPKEQA